MQLVDYWMVARIPAVRIYCVDLGLENLVLVMKVLAPLLDGREELDVVLHNCRRPLLTLLLVVRDVPHHEKEGDHVLIFLRRCPLA